MKRKIDLWTRFLRPTILMTVAVLAVADLSSAQQTPKELTNVDVIRMSKGGVPEAIIATAIQASPTNFDISANGLIELQKAGVSQTVMAAMLAAATNKQSPAAAPPTGGTVPVPGSPVGASTPPGSFPTPVPAPPQAPSPAPGFPATQPPTGVAPLPGQPSVAFLLGQNRQELAMEKTQLAETKAKPSSITSLASDSALGQSLQVGVNTAMTEMTTHVGSAAGNGALTQTGAIFSGMLAKRKPMTTYVWALPGPNSSNLASTNTPSFSVNFASGIGVHAEEFEPVVILLTPSPTGFRLVGATRGKEDATSSYSADWEVYSEFVEDRVPAQAQRLAPGQYQISIASPLAPGEYGVVLRPISRTKKFSGGAVARNQGDGLMFGSVWSFQIPAGARP